MLLVFLMSVLATVCVGRPYDEDITPHNVVTAPPNCPPGQEWINGQCREVWIAPHDKFLVSIVNLLADGPRNVVTVPENCPSGQQWINGQCRDVWPFLLPLPHNVVTVPPNCPEGQELINGVCRDVWNGDLRSILRSKVVDAIVNEFKNSIIKKKTKDAMRNIITVPSQCSNGSKPDALGICRPIFN